MTCKHIHTGKDGTSYCKLGEATGMEVATLRARIAELEALNASLKTSVKANKSNYIRQKKKTALYKKQLANTLSNRR